MKAPADAKRETTRRSVAVPFFGDDILAMSDSAAGLPGQMKSRRLKTRTARPKMKAV